MSTSQSQSIDEGVQTVPPTDSESADLVEQYTWLLGRFTAPEWSVAELRIERNEHVETTAHALEAALSHESGSVIHVVPFDPKEHLREKPVYQANRVRLRDNLDDANLYATLSQTVGEWDKEGYPVGQFTAQQTHPFAGAEDRTSFHEQTTVHQEDDTIMSSGERGEREYSIPALKGTIVAVFGAAQSITRTGDHQAGLESYF